MNLAVSQRDYCTASAAFGEFGLLYLFDLRWFQMVCNKIIKGSVVGQSRQWFFILYPLPEDVMEFVALAYSCCNYFR